MDFSGGTTGFVRMELGSEVIQEFINWNKVEGKDVLLLLINFKTLSTYNLFITNF